VAFGLSLGALAGEAGFTLFAVPVLPRLGALGVSVWSCALAVPMLAIASVFVDGADTWPRWHADVIGALVWLAVVVTAAAFVCWYAGVERLGPERAGLFAGLIPVSALVTGAVVGTSGIGAVAALGTVLVGIGITWGLRAGGPLVTPRPAMQSPSSMSRAPSDSRGIEHAAGTLDHSYTERP
jgi:drug/metabolite transporter (DMT)-like permease